MFLSVCILSLLSKLGEKFNWLGKWNNQSLEEDFRDVYIFYSSEEGSESEDSVDEIVNGWETDDFRDKSDTEQATAGSSLHHTTGPKYV